MLQVNTQLLEQLIGLHILQVMMLMMMMMMMVMIRPADRTNSRKQSARDAQGPDDTGLWRSRADSEGRAKLMSCIDGICVLHVPAPHFPRSRPYALLLANCMDSH